MRVVPVTRDGSEPLVRLQGTIEIGVRNMWAVYVKRNPKAVTCPWEVWEKLPDLRERFIGAYHTWQAAVRSCQG